MIEIKESRENLTGFLHISKITELSKIMGAPKRVVSNLTFYGLCDLIVELYDFKTLTNKKAEACFEILRVENTRLK
jgi:hypothetical protein